MPLKMNLSRQFGAPVTVHFHDESGNPAKGSFGATFKIVPFDELQEKEDASYLDMVLVGVKEDDLELYDEQNQRLTGDKLLDAVKNDPAISSALVKTYNEAITKKNRMRT